MTGARLSQSKVPELHVLPFSYCQTCSQLHPGKHHAPSDAITLVLPHFSPRSWLASGTSRIPQVLSTSLSQLFSLSVAPRAGVVPGSEQHGGLRGDIRRRPSSARLAAH